MKCILAVAVLLLVSVTEARIRHRYWAEDLDTEAKLRATADPLWFEQKIDQFDPANLATIKLRYLVNDTFWGGGAFYCWAVWAHNFFRDLFLDQLTESRPTSAGYPVFVMLGGEGPLSPRELTGRFIINNYAQRYKALMVAIEHRFYGESMPAGGLTLANLHYLTSHQANADFAAFIAFILKTYNTQSSKVVTLGGSYSGSLSAWMRQKYPHLVHAAVASSAPVLAQVDMPEYLQVIQASLGAACTARVRQAYQEISTLLATDSGRKELSTAYSTCDPISTTRFDQAQFLESVSGPICDTVQYNKDNIGRTITIDTICSILQTPALSAEAAMRQLHKFWNEANNVTCIDSTYASQIRELMDTDPSGPYASMRAWIWQTCTEFGYYQTAEGADTAFSPLIDLDYSLSMCKDAYGIDAQAVFANIDQTNIFFGGRNIATTRVVLPNGSIDPWHSLGVTQTSDPNLYPIYITGTAHCADLYEPSKDDLQGLTDARTKIVSLLNMWLQ